MAATQQQPDLTTHTLTNHISGLKPQQPPVVIVVYGGKGGIGKTTTSSAYAYLLGHVYGSTLLVDANADQPSAQLIYQTLQTDPPYDLTVENNPQLLAGVRDAGYQWVVVDCPPSPTEARAALDTADLVVIPYVPRWLETQAIMRTVKDVIADGTEFRVLLTCVEHAMRTRAAITREALAGFNVRVFDRHVRRYVAHEQAQSNGVPVFHDDAAGRFNHADRAVGDYAAVVRETVVTLRSRGVLSGE